MLSMIIRINRGKEASWSLLTSRDYQQSGEKGCIWIRIVCTPSMDRLSFLSPRLTADIVKVWKEKIIRPPLWVHQIWLMHTGRWWINHTRWGAGLTQVCAVVDRFPDKKVGGDYCIVSTHTKWLTRSLSNHTDKRQERLIQTNRRQVKPIPHHQRERR